MNINEAITYCKEKINNSDNLIFELKNERSEYIEPGSKHVYGVPTYSSASRLYLKITLKNSFWGLPEIIITKKVFLRNFIMAPFKILGLAKKSFSINSYYDCLCKNKKEAKEELNVLLNSNFKNLLTEFANHNIDIAFYIHSDTVYCQLLWDKQTRITGLQLELLCTELTNFKNYFKSNEIKLNLKRIKRAAKHITPELAKEIKFELNKNDNHSIQIIYPEKWYGFINLSSQDIFTDKNYSDKPVAEWLKSNKKLTQLTLDEMKSLFTYIIRQERFCDGFWKTFIEKNYLASILNSPVLKG